MGFAFSISFSLFLHIFVTVWIDIVSKYFSLCVMGMACFVCYCSHLVSCWAVTMWFSLFWYLPIVESENLFLNGFGVYLTYSFHLLEYWCWFSVLVTEFLWWHNVCLSTMCSSVDDWFLHVEIFSLVHISGGVIYVICSKCSNAVSVCISWSW